MTQFPSSTDRLLSFGSLLILLITIMWIANLNEAFAKTFQSTEAVSPTNAPTNTPHATKVATPAATPSIDSLQTSTPTPPPTPTPQIPISATELNQLINIQSELKKIGDAEQKSYELLNQQEKPGWLSQLDKVLDSSLAATLAGLALAAAALLISLQDKESSTILNRVAADLAVNPKPQVNIENLRIPLDQLKDANRDMIKSFYGFVMALIASLTIDAAVDMGDESRKKILIDLLPSVGGMSWGIFYMIKGAIKLHIIISPTQPPATLTSGTTDSIKPVETSSAPKSPGLLKRVGRGIAKVFRKQVVMLFIVR